MSSLIVEHGESNDECTRSIHVSHRALGLPHTMQAHTIRPERYGPPLKAFALERVPLPPVGGDECLVKVMAAGSITTASGQHRAIRSMSSHFRGGGQQQGFHIAGSDASGIVVAIGENVTDVQIGDEVVMHCGWWDEDAVDDQIMDRSAKIWGYEVNFGAFAEYTRVKQTALLPKPKHLLGGGGLLHALWSDCLSNVVWIRTPYPEARDVVLIWGGSGGWER